MKHRALTLATIAILAWANVARAQSGPSARSAAHPNAKRSLETKTPPGHYESTTDFLLKWAKADEPIRYQYAIDRGVTLTPTSDGRSFVLSWLPPTAASRDKSEKCPPLIVTLHGSQSWAFDEFYLWHPFAQERGYGIVALQWWRGHDAEDYYRPQEIYPILERSLSDLKATPGDALFHGFSRGSANSYAVAAIDRNRGQKFFSTIIANSGGYQSDYPPNAAIDTGQYGAAPFAGTTWILYGGGRDPHPDQSGLPAMRRTRDWLTKQGGDVALFLADEQGDHGSFHHTPDHVRAALDVFAKRLKR